LFSQSTLYRDKKDKNPAAIVNLSFSHLWMFQKNVKIRSSNRYYTRFVLTREALLLPASLMRVGEESMGRNQQQNS